MKQHQEDYQRAAEATAGIKSNPQTSKPGYYKDSMVATATTLANGGKF